MGGGRKYIIYAEDDIDDREMLAEMMERISGDIEVVAVNDGAEVLNYLSSLGAGDYLPCFVLLDVNMPVMNGFATLQAIRKDPTYDAVTVIMYSTANQSREIAKSTELGATRFITKPFSMDEIEALTREFVQFCENVPGLQKGAH